MITTLRQALAFSLVLTGTSIRAQPFNWQWAVPIDGGEGTRPGFANDADGNTYMAGQFSFAATFAPLPTLTGTDFNDGYVVKYDDQGQALWALPLSGTGTDICRGLSLDPAGNVYVTGDFSGPTLTIGSLTLTGNGAENIFVAKFTTDGQPVWARNYSDSTGQYESGRSIATNALGESYVTGHYQGTMALDDAPMLTACVNNQNMFLMKIDTDGNVLWNMNPACPSDPAYACWGDNVALDPNGDLYVVGRYSSPLCDVGDSLLVNTGPGSDDILFARFSPDGTQQWVYGMGGVNNDIARALATDAQGNCYLGINRDGDIVVPGLTVDGSGPLGPYRIATLKCNAAGQFLLGDRIGNSTGSHTVTSITAMPDGSYYLGGSFTYSCVIDGFFFPFVDFEHNNRAFKVRYDAASVAQQVLVLENNGTMAVQALSHDEAGNVYVVATIIDTATVGNLPIVSVPNSGRVLARSGDFSTAVLPSDPVEGTARAFPNPTAGRVRIDALLPFDRVEVTDAQGKLLLDRSFATCTAVDLELSTRGTLLYTLWSKGGLLGKGRVVRE